MLLSSAQVEHARTIILTVFLSDATLRPTLVVGDLA